MLMVNEKGEYTVIEETPEEVIVAVGESSEEDKLNKLAEGLSNAMSLAAVRSAAKQIIGGENG